MTYLAALRSATTTTAASFPMAVSIAVSLEALAISELIRVRAGADYDQASFEVRMGREDGHDVGVGVPPPLARSALTCALGRTRRRHHHLVTRGVLGPCGSDCGSGALPCDLLGRKCTLTRRAAGLRQGGTTLLWCTTVRACNRPLNRNAFLTGCVRGQAPTCTTFWTVYKPPPQTTPAPVVRPNDLIIGKAARVTTASTYGDDR